MATDAIVRHARWSIPVIAIALAALTAVPVAAFGSSGHDTVRFATFNASLNRGAAGALVADLSTPDNAQARTIAEIVQRTRPDVLLINEFDFVEAASRMSCSSRTTCRSAQNGAEPIDYAYRFIAPSNTGIASGFDLNNNGAIVTTPGAPGYGDDALGFGAFPGQFGMAVYSRYPIDDEQIRTFQHFLWKDMPGALLPDDPATPAPADWYSPAELAIFRLSSKSHWDLPIQIGNKHRALPGQPPDAAGIRRAGGPQRAAQLRRDPLLGRLHPARPRRLHLRRQGRHGGLQPGRAVRHRRRPELRPARRRQRSRARPSNCWTTRWINAEFTPTSAGAVEATHCRAART